ncbi:hypothetical protein GJ496_011070 [Pomphorhynchus laevis]|nr:hypothetical protein GJ496_011070 [Pomphorhynchus laevis]
MDLQIGSGCKAQGIDDVGNCLPLFLQKALRTALLTAFSISATRAYDQFVQRQMRSDQKVDVYLADLTRLFGIITTVHNEDFLKCVFVNGLPASVKSQLIISSNFSDMQLCDIVVKARSITVNNDRDKNIQCFTCHKTGHRSRDYPTKPIQRCYNCGSRDHLRIDVMVKMRVNGIDCNGLVDTGATRTLISKRIYLLTKGECTATLIDGSKVACKETVKIDIQLEWISSINWVVFKYLEGLLSFLEMRLSFIMYKRVMYLQNGKCLCFQLEMTTLVSYLMKIHVRVWKNGEPEKLYNSIASYIIDPDVQQDFENEVNCWILEGWLIPYDGEVRALIPLMAVMDATKSKVRPVLDFRGLNGFVTSNTADADVCVDKIRSWRRKGEHLSIMDLSRAYLQIYVYEKLWKYQVARFGGRQVCLTRLEFELNVAPKIMKAVVEKVITLDHNVRAACDSYLDDIIVDESQMSAKSVKLHLSKYGLKSKEPQKIDAVRVIGLKSLK